jgi:HK97 family phage portal protein
MWPFSRKSFDQVNEPLKNAILKALYEYNTHSGIATVMPDDQTAYISQGYSGNTDVYSIINRQCRMATQARLCLYKIENNKWVEVTDHELSKFTRKANPVMDMNTFIEGHIIYKQSIGNSFWYKPTIESGLNKGKTIELWLMPSNNVEIIGSGDWMNPIKEYDLTTNKTVKFKPTDIYHSKFFNPLFGENGSLYGQSPLKAAARTVSKQNEAELTELKQFQNQSPPYLLYRDVESLMGGLTPEQRGEIEGLFKDYSQKHKSGKPLVLPDKFGMISLGVSPVDLGILNSSQEGRRSLCNIYGLPAGLFNDTTNLSYNNMLQMEQGSWNNCIKPLLDSVGRDLTNCLINDVPEYVKAGLFFAYDYSEVAAMQKDRAQMVTWMRQAYCTPNEIREATGFNPYPDESMNEPWIGMGESPLSELTAPVEPLVIPNKGDYK